VRGGVDGVTRHHAVGRELAAGDHHEPGHGRHDRVLARDAGGRLGLAGEQRSEPGVDADDVLVVERLAEDRVDVREDVVDVGAARGGVGLVEVPGRVGGADDPVPAPRDHEEHGRLGADDESRVGPDPVARDDQVDALGRLDVERAAAAHHLLDVVGPDARRVDHDAGADLELTTVLQVDGAYADHPLALPEEAGHLDPRRHMGPVRGGGPGDREHQPGVVDLRVVVADRAVVVLRGEVRRQSGHGLAGQVPVPRQAGLAGAEPRHRVVEQQPGADVGALPAAVGQRVEERDRPDQVRRQPVEQQPALLERLADQPEVEHLQVTQAAVDQLAAAAAGAAGQVALLQQPGGEAAGDSVEGDAGADHPAADDEHVELVAAAGREHVEGADPGFRAERASAPHVKPIDVWRLQGACIGRRRRAGRLGVFRAPPAQRGACPGGAKRQGTLRAGH
jgi:hypothetical protein